METRFNRREFLRRYGIASSALTLSPFFLDRLTTAFAATATAARVYKVQNGDCFQNTAKLWELLGGVARFIAPSDVVVIKGNAQWYNQGYTHTGCIKGVVDQILALPGFNGEILICDNVQGNNDGSAAGQLGFDATWAYRVNNWPDHNWDSLAAAYQAQGKPVATKRWSCGPWRAATNPSLSIWNPADGPGWTRSFFTFNGRPTFLSYPIFESPLTPGRLIDLKNGVWENGAFTGRRVKTIIMPTLNNHGYGAEDYAGVTSAIKSFFGATEIPGHWEGTWNGFYHIHSSSFTQNSAAAAGELVGRWLNTFFIPQLFITAAEYVGHHSRTQAATRTKTVLAGTDPVSLDYIACRDVIAPYAAWLHPDQNNNTRKQILGCQSQGIGTADPAEIEVVEFDFNRPTATRVDVERKLRDFKAGQATEAEVKAVLRLYMDSN